MSVTFTNPVNGDPLDAAAIQAELDAGREFLAGGVVGADVSLVRRPALPQPIISGFPTNGHDAEFQSIRRAGAIDRGDYFPIVRSMLDANGRTKINGLSRSRFLELDDVVYIFAHWSLYSARYTPDTSRSDHRTGKFLLRITKHTTGATPTSVDREQTRRLIYGFDGSQREFHFVDAFYVKTRGNYDFDVIYDIDDSTFSTTSVGGDPAFTDLLAVTQRRIELLVHNKGYNK